MLLGRRRQFEHADGVAKPGEAQLGQGARQGVENLDRGGRPVVVHRAELHGRGAGDDDNPNQIEVGQLSALEKRIVKEGLRQARKLQSRLRLDFPG